MTMMSLGRRDAGAQVRTRTVATIPVRNGRIEIRSTNVPTVQVAGWQGSSYVLASFDCGATLAWADSAPRFVSGAAPRVVRSDEKVTLQLGAPEDTESGRRSDFTITRTVTLRGSSYTLFMSDGYVVNTVHEMMTRASVTQFIAAMRRAAIAASELAGTSTACAVPTFAAEERSEAAASVAASVGAFFEFQVEAVAIPLDNAPVPYPAAQAATKQQAGDVLAQFVVDTTGRVEMNTFKILKSSNDAFASAVREHVATWRYRPAEAGGRKVRQVVQIPFAFEPPN